MKYFAGFIAFLILAALPIYPQCIYTIDQKGFITQDPHCTPGPIRTIDAGEICSPSFRTGPYRKTTESMKKKVCEEYRAKDCPNAKKGEIDHLVPLELGGLDAIENLWWQPAPQYHWKDKLENRLHKAVCDHELSLQDAQDCIKDWVSCAARYKLLPANGLTPAEVLH